MPASLARAGLPHRGGHQGPPCVRLTPPISTRRMLAEPGSNRAAGSGLVELTGCDEKFAPCRVGTGAVAAPWLGLPVVLAGSNGQRAIFEDYGQESVQVCVSGTNEHGCPASGCWRGVSCEAATSRWW